MANSCCLELSKTLPFQPGSPGVKKHCTSPDAFAVCPTSHSQTSHDGWLGKTLPLTGSPSILVGKYLCLSGPLKLWPSVGFVGTGTSAVYPTSLLYFKCYS